MQDLTSRGAIEEYWCAIKHALHQEGHLEESISNMAREGDDEKVLKLAKMLDDVRRRRQELVRMALEKEVSSTQPVSSTGCIRCADDLELKKLFKLSNSSNVKYIYSSNPIGNPKEVSMTTIESVTPIVGAAFVGSFASKTIPKLDSYITPTAVKVHEKASTWIGILGGIAGVYASTKLSEKLSLPIAVASSVILANTVTNILIPNVSLQKENKIVPLKSVQQAESTQEQVEKEAKERLVVID